MWKLVWFRGLVKGLDFRRMFTCYVLVHDLEEGVAGLGGVAWDLGVHLDGVGIGAFRELEGT